MLLWSHKTGDYRIRSHRNGLLKTRMQVIHLRAGLCFCFKAVWVSLANCLRHSTCPQNAAFPSLLSGFWRPVRNSMCDCSNCQDSQLQQSFTFPSYWHHNLREHLLNGLCVMQLLSSHTNSIKRDPKEVWWIMKTSNVLGLGYITDVPLRSGRTIAKICSLSWESRPGIKFIFTFSTTVLTDPQTGNATSH